MVPNDIAKLKGFFFFIGGNMTDLRQEQCQPKWRAKAFKAKGKKCAVCGSKEGLQIHHVLALANGGTNDMDNLLVVCEMHHKQMHQKIHKNMTNAGRPRKCTYEQAKPILERYFNMEIGQAECIELLGYSQSNHTGIFELKQIYKREYNVPKDFFNNIDLKAAQGKRIKMYI